MSLLQRYVDYLRAGDAGKFASLFTEDAEFYDDGFTKVGLEPVSLKGRDNIEAFIKGLFSQAQGSLNVVNVAINGNAIRYDIKHGDMVFLALGVTKEENDLIKEYRVTVV